MVVRTALVLAVVVMVNYLGAQFFDRFYLSSQTQRQLSSRTVERAAFDDEPRRRDALLRQDRTIFIRPSSRC